MVGVSICVESDILVLLFLSPSHRNFKLNLCTTITVRIGGSGTKTKEKQKTARQKKGGEEALMIMLSQRHSAPLPLRHSATPHSWLNQDTQSNIHVLWTPSLALSFSFSAVSRTLLVSYLHEEILSPHFVPTLFYIMGNIKNNTTEVHCTGDFGHDTTA